MDAIDNKLEELRKEIEELKKVMQQKSNCFLMIDSLKTFLNALENDSIESITFSRMKNSFYFLFAETTMQEANLYNCISFDEIKEVLIDICHKKLSKILS